MNDDKKRALLEQVSDYLRAYEQTGFKYVSNTITDDETWIYNHDPTTKEEAKRWRCSNSPYAQTPPAARLTTKSYF